MKKRVKQLLPLLILCLVSFSYAVYIYANSSTPTFAEPEQNTKNYKFVSKDNHWLEVLLGNVPQGKGYYQTHTATFNLTYEVSNLEPDTAYQVEIWTSDWQQQYYAINNCTEYNGPAIVTDSQGHYSGTINLPGLPSGKYTAVIKKDDCPKRWNGKNYQFVLFESQPIQFTSNRPADRKFLSPIIDHSH